MMHGLFVFLFMLMLGPVVVFGQKNCTLKIEKDSIKVFLCKTGNSRFKAIKSSFIVKSRLSQLAAMVMDIEYYKEWQYKAIDNYVLKKVNDRELIYYNSIALPVISNRDFVVRLNIDQNQATKEMTIDMTSVPAFIQKKKNFIRVPYSKARWTIKPLTATLLQVDYCIELDPGGSVPPWLVNLLADKAPYESFREFRRKIGKHKNSRISFIKD